MSKFLKILGIIIVLFSLVITGCSKTDVPAGNTNRDGDNKETKAYIVGTNAAFPPFEFRDENDKLVGFDIDLMEAIAKEAGFEIVWEDMSFEGLIGALTSSRIDIIAAGMTINEERLLSVDFSIPYFDAGQSIVVLKGTEGIKDIDDLIGKTVGVQIGTTADIYMDFYDDINVNQYDNYPLAFLDLINGNIDAVIADHPVAKQFVEENKNVVIAAETFTEEQFGFAVRKNSQELLEIINNGLEAIIESGLYDEIYKKWFK